MKLDLGRPSPSSIRAGWGGLLIVLVGACWGTGAGPKSVGGGESSLSEREQTAANAGVESERLAGSRRESVDGGGPGSTVPTGTWAGIKVGPGPVGIGVEPSAAAIGAAGGVAVAAIPPAQHLPLTVTVDSERIVRRITKKRFLGSNLTLSDKAATYERDEIKQMLTEAGIGLLRLPGGLGRERLADGLGKEQYFWNGKGVRNSKGLDSSKYKNGHWSIDYSGWAPGFYGLVGFPKVGALGRLVRDADCNVKQQLDFVRSVGAEPFAVVNADTGSAHDAAEWVRWANAKQGYGVKLWEVRGGTGPSGPAFVGSPDSHGTDGSPYGEAYEAFANEMKSADPTILVGAQGGLELIKSALSRKDAPVDFVALRDYFTPHANSADAMFDSIEKIKQRVGEVREIVSRLRPGSDILVGMSEYNCKLFPDEQTSDVNSGLWIISAVGEMMYGGLDFATQWDAFTQEPEKGGGHGLLIEGEAVPKAEYWAFLMLNRYFGDTLLSVERSNPYARAYASKNADGDVYVFVVNTSQSTTFDAEIDVKGAKLQPVADCARFSEREYTWDPTTFSALWNGGPTQFRARFAKSAKLTLPRASAIACRMRPLQAAPQLFTLGPAVTMLAPQGQATVSVAAYDEAGRPRPGAVLRAGIAGGFAASPGSAKTGDDGLATFVVRAPAGPGEGRLLLHADGFPSAEQSLRAVSPTIVVGGPAKAQVGEAAWFIAGARYKDGGRYRLLESPEAPAVVRVMDAKGEGTQRPLVFDDAGMSSFSVSSATVGARSVMVEANGVSTKNEISFYDRVAGDALALTFSDSKSLERLRGKAALRINTDVRSGDGVLEVRLQGMKGWTQHLVDVERLDELASLDRESIRGVYFDLMVDDKLDTKRRYAHFVVVLQSELNSWMPLEKIDLSRFPRGQWQRVVLPIGKPDWQKSMKGLRKIVTVVNSAAELDGMLYFDNVGFLLQRPR